MFKLPSDPKKRKQLLITLGAAGGLLGVYLYLQHRNAAASTTTTAATTTAADPANLAGQGIDGLAATSGLPATDQPVTLSAIEAAIAQARSLLHSLGFKIVAPGRPHKKKRPVRDGGHQQGGNHKKHPSTRKTANGGRTAHQPGKSFTSNASVVRPRSQIGQTSTRSVPRPTRVASRRMK